MRIDWLILGFEWLVLVIAASVLVWLFRQGYGAEFETQAGWQLISACPYAGGRPVSHGKSSPPAK